MSLNNIKYAEFQNCIIDEVEIKKEVNVKRFLFIEDDLTTGVLTGLFYDTSFENSLSDYTFMNLSALTFDELQNKEIN